MPRGRFLDPQDRARARVVRRRRTILTALLEATGLCLLMGLVPPLRQFLYVAGGLAVLLMVYVVALVQIRSTESTHPRRDLRGTQPSGTRSSRVPPRVAYPVGYAPEAVYPGGNGRGYESTYGDGFSDRTKSRAGHPAKPIRPGVVGAEPAGRAAADPDVLQILDDDVHVIIRRAAEVEAEAGAAAAGARSAASG